MTNFINKEETFASKPIKRFKVILLGDLLVGKTSLRQVYLREKLIKFIIPETQTEGKTSLRQVYLREGYEFDPENRDSLISELARRKGIDYTQILPYLVRFKVRGDVGLSDIPKSKREHIYEAVSVIQDLEDKINSLNFIEQREILDADVVNIHLSINNQRISTQIWDFKYRLLSTAAERHFTNTSGCLLVFDLTSPSSIESITNWATELLKFNFNRKIPFVLVGNKSDRNKQDYYIQILIEECSHSLSQLLGFSVPYIETSAKTGENVEEAFDVLFNAMNQFKSGTGAPTHIFPRDDSP